MTVETLDTSLAVTVGRGLLEPIGARLSIAPNGSRARAIAEAIESIPSGIESWWAPALFRGDHRQEERWEGAASIAVDVDFYDANAKHAAPDDERRMAFREFVETGGVPANAWHSTPRGGRLIIALSSFITDRKLWRSAARATCNLTSQALARAGLAPEMVDGKPCNGYVVDAGPSCDLARLLFTPKCTYKGKRRSAEVIVIREDEYDPEALCIAALTLEPTPDRAANDEPSKKQPGGGSASASFADAVRRWNDAHPQSWPRSGGKCPTCMHSNCFGTLPNDPSRWYCWSSSHGGDSGRCGIETERGWTGDALDLEAHRSGMSRADVLRRDGCLEKQRGRGETPKTDGTNGSVGNAGPAVEVGIHLTDVGNALRFVRDHGDRIRFVHTFGTWLHWNGSHWQRDDTAEILRLARKTAGGMLAEASRIDDDEKRKSLAKHALKVENQSRLQAMVSLASSDLRVAITSDALDTDPWLLTVKNGTLDLRVPELREHRSEDLITHCLPVEYDIGAPAPIWERFLDRIFAGNKELVAFVKRGVGYSLTGLTREQVIFLLLGRGDNGKSTFLEALRALLGSLAKSASFETFLESKNKGSQIPNDVARLRGARFVTAIEADGERRLAEATIKKMTGSDTITARFLNQEFFEFIPQFTLWLAANHRPVIRGTDHAIWRRIRLIPFDVTIPREERDQQLTDKLRAELPGILAWAVEGCFFWRTDGLGESGAVKTATESYRADMDSLGGFLEERCELGREFSVASSDLYNAYKTWAEKSGEVVLAKRTLGVRLQERNDGFIQGKVLGARGWIGLRLRGVSA